MVWKILGITPGYDHREDFCVLGIGDTCGPTQESSVDNDINNDTTLSTTISNTLNISATSNISTSSIQNASITVGSVDIYAVVL